MDIALIRLEPFIRLTCFFLVLSGLAFWQYRKPHRLLLSPLSARWKIHGALFVISLTCLGALFLSILPIQMAVEVLKHHIGILQLPSFAFLPQGIKGVLAILGLDLCLYVEHRLLHRFPLAWRFHKMHHTDKEVEVSTGMRFHPLESIVTMGVKIMAIIFIGPPVWSVILFEILLNAATLWAHVNAFIPIKIEKRIRPWFVTPALHRLHHSELEAEHHRNFGFIFSIWDKLFSTYQDGGGRAERFFTMGLGPPYRADEYQTLKSLLTAPFRRAKKKPSASLKPYMKSPF